MKNILVVAGGEELQYLVQGLAAEQNGFLLTDAQAKAVDDTLGSHAAALQALQTKLDEANQAREAAQASLATANETIATQTTTIADRDARITALENEPERVKQTARESDDDPKTPSYMQPSHAANAAADRLMGTPVAKK